MTLSTLHDVALLDLDGVVYVGDQAVPGAVEALSVATEAGMRCAFVTNNASRRPEDIAAHLVDLGIPATPDQVVTSAQAAAQLLAQVLPPKAIVLAVGGPGVAAALEGVGLRPVTPHDAPEGDVDAVLQGFGRDVAWSDLAAAALAIQRGARWILTNPDLTLPIAEGQVPGNGSLARAVEAAAGRPPDDIAGKPHPALMRASIERSQARSPLVVGDRLDTDIAGAVRAGVPSLLVLTGVTDVMSLLRAAPVERPDFIGVDLSALNAAPVPVAGEGGPRPHDHTWGQGDSRAWIDGGHLVVEGSDWLTGLRCACAAAWACDHPPDVDAAAARLERARPPVPTGRRTVGT